MSDRFARDYVIGDSRIQDYLSQIDDEYERVYYTGITYEFWRSCDAVGDERSYVMLGTPNCGKGEPGQAGHVGHGVSGARFRNVRVGVVA